MQKYANRKDMMNRRKGESRPEPVVDPPMMFANLNHVIYRDLNGTTRAPTFAKLSLISQIRTDIKHSFAMLLSICMEPVPTSAA